MEEGAKISRSSWAVLTPTIREPGSEIWVSFNPELETDYIYARLVKRRDDDAVELGDGSWSSKNAFVVKMTWRDNPWFPEVLKAEMEIDRKTDYDRYLNVWEGHCLTMLEGVVYARELRRATSEGRICKVPYSEESPVDTFWDLGRRNWTSIWFAQRVGLQYRILAYYQANMTEIDFDDPTGGMGHFIKELQRRPYVYGLHHLPHDAKAKRLGTGKSVEEQLKAAVGVKNVTIVAKLSLMDGVNAARMIFGNCWFDEEKCADGLNALRHYKYKVVEGQYSNEPLHDGAGFVDGADAFRYLAVDIGRKRGTDASGVKERLEDAAAAVKAKFGRGQNGRQGVPGQGWMR